MAVSVLLYVVGWIVTTQLQGWGGEVIRAAGLASIVGGLCDALALKMLFDKSWYLPFSGVIPRNRQQLIGAIGNTVENEWLTPETIGAKLKELDLVTHLGRYLEKISGEDINFLWIQGHAAQVAAFLERPETIRQIADALRGETMVWLTESFHLFDPEQAVRRFAGRMHEIVGRISTDRQFRNHIEEWLRNLGRELQIPGNNQREQAGIWIERLLDIAVLKTRGEIAKTVKQKLEKLSDEEIKVQIESKTRPHLEWIRINGSAFGALFGLGLALLQARIKAL
ncbi:MAG: DUF445 family protein [Candidatus Binataceae bacterium]